MVDKETQRLQEYVRLKARERLASLPGLESIQPAEQLERYKSELKHYYQESGLNATDIPDNDILISEITRLLTPGQE